MNESSTIKLGSCAWSFDDWRGVFYPPDLPAAQWLEFYARHLPAVEIDSTFYAPPKPQTAGYWLDATPPDFSFTAKMPRAITHEARLRDCREGVREFLDALAPLSSRLGCVLIQLPRSFSAAEDESALRQFVMELPRSYRFAIEFRNADWHLPRIIRFLEDNNVCWVWSDTTPLEAQNRGAFEPLPLTADFVYVRLLGDLENKYCADGSRRHHYRELAWPRNESLDSWALKIERHAADCTRLYVMVSNHFEGFAPATCQRLGRQLGLGISLPAPEPPPAESTPQQQMDLL